MFYVHQVATTRTAASRRSRNTLLGDLSEAIKAFDDAMEALGLGNNVTLFTLVRLRPRRSSPPSNAGTDHGWGNYAFVAGGAVKGGDFYGTRARAGARTVPTISASAGRWIPTTSLEQYGATLARWFGIAEGDLPYVFPNIGAFAEHQPRASWRDDATSSRRPHGSLSDHVRVASFLPLTVAGAPRARGPRHRGGVLQREHQPLLRHRLPGRGSGAGRRHQRQGLDAHRRPVHRVHRARAEGSRRSAASSARPAWVPTRTSTRPTRPSARR